MSVTKTSGTAMLEAIGAAGSVSMAATWSESRKFRLPAWLELPLFGLGSSARLETTGLVRSTTKPTAPPAEGACPPGAAGRAAPRSLVGVGVHGVLPLGEAEERAAWDKATPRDHRPAAGSGRQSVGVAGRSVVDH